MHCFLGSKITPYIFSVMKVLSWIVLGLMADQADIYETRSNRESGFGRYDVMLIPRDRKRQGLPAVIMEFKVHNSRQEADLEATVQAALPQIEEKNYDAELFGTRF